MIITHALQPSLYITVPSSPKVLPVRPYVSVGKNRSLVCTFFSCYSDDNESRGRYKLAVKAKNLNHRKKKANAIQHTAQILTDNTHLKMST